MRFTRAINLLSSQGDLPYPDFVRAARPLVAILCLIAVLTAVLAFTPAAHGLFLALPVPFWLFFGFVLVVAVWHNRQQQPGLPSCPLFPVPSRAPPTR